MNFKELNERLELFGQIVFKIMAIITLFLIIVWLIAVPFIFLALELSRPVNVQ